MKTNTNSTNSTNSTLALSQHIAICEQCRRAIMNSKTNQEWNMMACKIGKDLNNAP